MEEQPGAEGPGSMSLTVRGDGVAEVVEDSEGDPGQGSERREVLRAARWRSYSTLRQAKEGELQGDGDGRVGGRDGSGTIGLTFSGDSNVRVSFCCHSWQAWSRWATASLGTTRVASSHTRQERLSYGQRWRLSSADNFSLNRRRRP